MINDKNEDTDAALGRARHLAHIATTYTPPLSEDDHVDRAKYKMRREWEALGFKVCQNERPVIRQRYRVPSFTTVLRERHFFSVEQVHPKSGRMGSSAIPGVKID
jgi:hypothetical protein